jgi:hypothetical protein
MIVADRKPLDEILDSIKDYKKIMLMGCGGCVTICFSGGAKAVELLASQIKMARKKQGKEIEIIECTPERQCEYEFIDELKKELDTVEAVLSIACGVGVQAMTERHPESITIPGLNTKFMGYPVEHALCEVEKDTECAWQLIYDRLKKLGKLDNLTVVREPKDWRTSTNAGQRKTKFEEAML